MSEYHKMVFPFWCTNGLASEPYSKKSLATHCTWWFSGGKSPNDVCTGPFRTIYGNSITGEIPEGTGQAEGRMGKGPKGGGRGRAQILWGGRKFPGRNLTLKPWFLKVYQHFFCLCCMYPWGMSDSLYSQQSPINLLKESYPIGCKRLLLFQV